MKTQVRISMLGLLLLIANGVFAQDDSGYNEFRAKMNSIFQYVNKDKVPTGLLSDYGMQLIAPNGFDGIPTDTNYVNFNVWKQLYFGMYDSRINTKITLQEPNPLFANIIARKSLAIMYLNYNILDDTSISRGLLTFNNEQIREVPGAASPYLSKELFVISPYNSSFNSKAVSFTFDRQCYVSNSGFTVTKLEVNFNNGSGFREAQWGIPISCTYSSNGEKEIIFRMTFSNGKNLSSRTKIFVSEPVYTRATGAKSIESIDIPEVNGKHKGGTMQLMHCSDQTNKKYIRPLIIAEDLDISKISDKNINLESLIGDPNLGPVINQLSQLYDIIYIDYKDGLDDINKNASLLRDAINKVNQNLFQVLGTTVADSIYVVGLGMGGLVARVALNMMETNHEQHRVRKLISINTPYRGLNMPAGLQSFIRHIRNVKLGKSSLADIIGQTKMVEALLDSKAMRQMLFYNVNSKVQYDNTEYQNFMNSSNVTRTPLLCQNIAIAGGSPYNNKTLFQPESSILDIHEQYYIINNWFWNLYLFGNLNAKFDFTAKALPNQKDINIYDGHIYLSKRIFFWHVDINLSHIKVNSFPDMYPIDGASGINISLNSLLKKDSSSDTNNKMDEALKIDRFCFIPTVSALGLIDWKDKLSAYYLLPTGENSMCNRYYCTDDNNDYMNLAAFKDILFSELAPQIKGNTKDIWNDTEFFIDNMPNIALMTYNWRFKNNNFQVVSRSGSHAVIRPLKFGVKDEMSVNLSIPFIGLNVDLATKEVSSLELRLQGDEYISKIKNHYQLSRTPDCDTLYWRASEGVIIDKQKGNYMVAHTETALAEAWIEAVISTGGHESTLRKNLKSKKIERVMLVRNKSWIGTNDKGELCQQFEYQLIWSPGDIPEDRLSFCWGSDLEKSGKDTDPVTPPIIIGGGSLGGLSAKLITEGDVEGWGGICMTRHLEKDSISLEDSKLCTDSATVITPTTSVYTNATLPLEPFEPYPDPDPYDPNYPKCPCTVVVVMPTITDGGDITGVLRCSVNDYLGEFHTVKVNDLYAKASLRSSSYSSSPNPANSSLIIKRVEENDVQASTYSMPVPETITAALYNSYGMVRNITFDSSETRVDMNVSDLPEGTYYLNILKEGNVIESQVVFIKH